MAWWKKVKSSGCYGAFSIHLEGSLKEKKYVWKNSSYLHIPGKLCVRAFYLHTHNYEHILNQPSEGISCNSVTVFTTLFIISIF